MGNLLFLIVPAVLAAVAVTVVWLRNRPETSPTAGIDRFSDQMAALAPDRLEDRAGLTILTPDESGTGPDPDGTGAVGGTGEGGVDGVAVIDDTADGRDEVG